MNKQITTEDVAKLTESLRRLTETTAGKIVASSSGAVLPYQGIPWYSTPPYLFLKENLICTKDSPLNHTIFCAVHIILNTPNEECVLITGSTGSGKETFAKAFKIGNAPFIAVNCTSLPDYLIESELFGHVAGAFTGAIKDKTGLMVAAQHGVLLLDEIGDMPLSLQPKLLRVIQERTVRPVGSNTEVPIKCRIIASTNKVLKVPHFREDLLWRINTYNIDIPPLGERKDDAIEYIKKTCPKLYNEEPSILNNLDYAGGYRMLQQLVKRYRLRILMKQAGMPPATK